jgi:hypothetical protein
VVYLAATCGTADVESDCPVPADGSRQGDILSEGRQQSAFPILYPCKVPNSETLTSVNVVGDKGKQSVSVSFDGPFQITIRQSQVAPLVNADPSGSSHSVVDNLFPGVRAELIEINDGSGHATYHLIWDRGGMYYEVLMTGPPLQRKAVLDLARSLQ